MIYYLSLRTTDKIKLQKYPSEKEGMWDPINWFKPAIFLCMFKAETWIFPTPYFVGFFFFCQLFKVRDSCSF